MVKKILFKFSNRWLYTFIIFGIIAIFGVGVYAVTAGTAPNPGHLLSEVSPPSGCSNGQYIKWDGTNLVCSSVSSGGTSQWTTSGSDIYYTNGKVGIGTVTPSTALHLGNVYNTKPELTIDTHDLFELTFSGAANANIRSANSDIYLLANAIHFGTGGTNDKVIIDASGNMQVTGSLNIGYEIKDCTAGNTNSCSCPSGKNPLGGGATCPSGYYLDSSHPSSLSWYAYCRKPSTGVAVFPSLITVRCARIG